MDGLFGEAKAGIEHNPWRKLRTETEHNSWLFNQSFRFPSIRNFRISPLSTLFITSIDFLYYLKLKISFLYMWTPSTLKLTDDLTYPKFSPWTEYNLSFHTSEVARKTPPSPLLLSPKVTFSLTGTITEHPCAGISVLFSRELPPPFQVSEDI